MVDPNQAMVTVKLRQRPLAWWRQRRSYGVFQTISVSALNRWGGCHHSAARYAGSVPSERRLEKKCLDPGKSPQPTAD